MEKKMETDKMSLKLGNYGALVCWGRAGLWVSTAGL